MKFINPLGRTYSKKDRLNACMCSENFFAAAKGNDSCIHCGCACSESGEFRSGNNVAATRTIRSS